ncbi:hypothetical protein [Catalinimonas alkaloidigena]|uniref:hypothetical protein n=1 Tax=Catalinimonas alkaloidigena TaxID=1075417 RepID=UPI000B7D7DBF|nr:hypothetical protein [Catalinimonas alkaloidigena]
MSTNSYAVFRIFSDASQATELALLLQEHGIDTHFENNAPVFDVTFSGNRLQDEVQLMIKQEDFERANRLLEQEAEKQLDQTHAEHYLHSFTNEELYEILIKPDEWSVFDRQFAQKLLTERGQSLSDDLVRLLQEKRLEELSQPETKQNALVYAGYLFAFLGGLFGIIIGLHLWTTMKTLPNGQKVYTYSDRDRTHGRNIFLLALVLLPIMLTAKLLK